MTKPTATGRRLAASALLLLAVAIADKSARAEQLSSLADEYRLLIDLGQHPRDRAKLDRQYQRLSGMSPGVGVMAYTHALLLTDQRKYRDAVRSSATALAQDSGNLNVWKLHIWLQLQNDQFAPALKSVAELASYMPDESATGRRRVKGERMAEYFGTVVGYVAYPRAGALPRYDVQSHGRAIRDQLTSSQRSAFDQGFGRVRAINANKREIIADQRQRAYDADLGSREALIAQMAADRERIQAELLQLEELRLQAKALATSERNTLAATRESFVAGSSSRAAEDGVSVTRQQRFGVGIGAGGVGMLASRTGNVSAYDHDYADASFAAGSKGFGTKAYDSVKDRNEDYDKYLAKKGAKLQLQLQVMERKEVALRNKPAVGSSALVARLERKSKLLTEYMALPVDTDAEVIRLLAKLDR